jgi:hypothetical protein
VKLPRILDDDDPGRRVLDPEVRDNGDSFDLSGEVDLWDVERELDVEDAARGCPPPPSREEQVEALACEIGPTLLRIAWPSFHWAQQSESESEGSKRLADRVMSDALASLRWASVDRCALTLHDWFVFSYPECSTAFGYSKNHFDKYPNVAAAYHVVARSVRRRFLTAKESP